MNEGPAPIHRRLATILCADVAGYSQLMGANEERTVRTFRGHREIFQSLVELHRGRIFNTAGDALLAEFNSAVEAVRCATEIQAALQTRNAQLPAEERMLFRIGINLGDVIIQGDDLLGDGVNVAARIQTATEPGGICISGSVYDQIQNKLSLEFRPLGEQSYKNISKPVRTYTIAEGAAVTAPPRGRLGKWTAVVGLCVIALAGAGWWGYQQFRAHVAEQEQAALRLSEQLAAQKAALEKAQRSAEDAKRAALLQAQRTAAEEALRRAQDERARLEQDRARLLLEKRAATDALARAKPAESIGAAPAPAKSATAARYDGIYNGRLCTHVLKEDREFCWKTVLHVRNGLAESTWISTPSQNMSKAVGPIDAAGNLDIRVSGWTRKGEAIDAVMTGRATNDGITAAGQWRNGNGLKGNWERAR